MQHGDSSAPPRGKAGSIVWAVVAVLFGWTAFAFWWLEVLNHQRPRPFLSLVLVVALFCAIVLLTTFGWIRHNRKLADRGQRGRSSRFAARAYEQDAVGRQISLLQYDVITSAPVVTVSATPDTKTYSTA